MISESEERYPVRLVSQAGVELDGVFSFNDEERTDEDCKLTLQFSDGEISATDWNYFDALCRIREQLESRGLRPVCYGSCRNVTASMMSCQMGSGLQAYKLTLGQPGRLKDLVGIFETGPDVEPVTVEQQERFREEWLESLKKT